MKIENEGLSMNYFIKDERLLSLEEFIGIELKAVQHALKQKHHLFHVVDINVYEEDLQSVTKEKINFSLN